MQFNAKTTEFGLGIWEVKINGEEWTKFLENAKTTLLKNVSVPGFRKGKVPHNIAVKHVNEDMILREASRMGFKKGFEFANKQESEIKPVSQISPEIVGLSKKECTINYRFDIKSEVKIKSYKDFKINKNKVVVKEEQIKQELEKVKENFTILNTKKGKVANHNQVVIDFDGKINGKSFEGGNATNYNLTIGSHSFIEGFEESLIGMETGKSKTIDLHFPKDYHVKALKGKPVSFDVTVKEVKTRKVPKMDDELIKDLNIKDVDTVAKYKEFVKTELQKRLEANEKQSFLDLLLDAIAKDSNVIVQNSLIINHAKKLFKEFEAQVQGQGLTIKDYCARTGLTMENINEELDKDAKKALQHYFIMQQIADQEKITASKDDIKAKYEIIAKQFSLKLDDDRLKKYFPENRIVDEIVREKVSDFLYDNN